MEEPSRRRATRQDHIVICHFVVREECKLPPFKPLAQDWNQDLLRTRT